MDFFQTQMTYSNVVTSINIYVEFFNNVSKNGKIFFHDVHTFCTAHKVSDVV